MRTTPVAPSPCTPSNSKQWLWKRPLPVVSHSHLGLTGSRDETMSACSVGSFQANESDGEDFPAHLQPRSPHPYRTNACKVFSLTESLQQSCQLAEASHTFTDLDRQWFLKLCSSMGYNVVSESDRELSSVESTSTTSSGSMASQVPIKELQRRMGSPFHHKKTSKAARPAEVLLGFLTGLIARIPDPPALHAHLLAHGPRLFEVDELNLLLASNDGSFWDVSTGTSQPNAGILGYVWTTGQAVNLPCFTGNSSFGANQHSDLHLDVKCGAAFCAVPIPGRGLLTALREGGTMAPVPFQDDEFELLRSIAKLLAAGESPSRFNFTASVSLHQGLTLQKRCLRFRPVMAEQVRHVLGIQVSAEERARLCTLEFDVHMLAVMNDGMDRMLRLLVMMLEELGLVQELGVDVAVLVRFLLRVRSLYNSVKYHSFLHAFDVAHMAYFLIKTLAEDFPISPLEKYVWLIAAILHDVGHEGLNNNFYKNTHAPLALLAEKAGSQSILELYHCQLAIEILSDPETNAFHVFNGDALTNAHTLLLDLILATDIALHTEISNRFSETKPPATQLILKMLIKVCDLSNAAKPFHLSKRWAESVMEEFWEQGDREKEAGLDVIPLFDRANAARVPEFQIDFLNFLAIKHFHHLAEWCPKLNFLVNNAENNRTAWQAKRCDTPQSAVH